MNLQTAAEKFYAYQQLIRGFSPATIRRYKYVLTSLIKQTGNIPVVDISEAVLKELFFHGRTTRNWSTNTYRVFHKSLLVFFKWCMQHGFVTANPVTSIEKPKIEQKIPQKLTRQEASKLLEYIYHYSGFTSFLRCRNHAIFATFIYSGLRKSELLHLNYTDVDLVNKTIYVHKGKGAKDRIVPICDTQAESLNRYLVERKKCDNNCPSFFISSHHNKAFTDDGLKHLVLKVQQITRLKFSVHKLRHSFATLMLEGGCDIYSLSKMMGHSQIGTTTIYLSASIEHLRKEIYKHPLN